MVHAVAHVAHGEVEGYDPPAILTIRRCSGAEPPEEGHGREAVGDVEGRHGRRVVDRGQVDRGVPRQEEADVGVDRRACGGVEVQVSDSGPGIPPALHANLFTRPTYQTGVRGRSGGLGLGCGRGGLRRL